MLGRGFVEWQGVIFVWLLVVWRFSFSAIALPLRLQRRVLIIGAGKAGQEIHTIINRHKNSGLTVAGFLDDNPQKIGITIDGTPVLGNSTQLGEMITSHKIGMLVMAIPVIALARQGFLSLLVALLMVNLLASLPVRPELGHWSAGPTYAAALVLLTVLGFAYWSATRGWRVAEPA